MSIVISKFCRLLTVFLSMAAIIMSFSPSAAADWRTGSVDVVKKWDNRGQALPDSVTLYLERGGSTVAQLSLSAADEVSGGDWQGRFENVPLYDGSGLPIQYSVREEPVENYSFSLLQRPQPASLGIRDWAEKVTPASQSRYPIGRADLVVANKGNRYYVWTRDELSESERELLLYEINSASLQGFGAELSFDNSHFESGLPARFSSSGVGIYKNGDEAYISFERTNVWSLFYAGSYDFVAAKAAVTLNSAKAPQPTPTVSPSPTPGITPSPSPQPSAVPSPAPSDPPRTGDLDLERSAGVLIVSVLIAAVILFKLKKQ